MSCIGNLKVTDLFQNMAFKCSIFGTFQVILFPFLNEYLFIAICFVIVLYIYICWRQSIEARSVFSWLKPSSFVQQCPQQMTEMLLILLLWRSLSAGIGEMFIAYFRVLPINKFCSGSVWNFAKWLYGSYVTYALCVLLVLLCLRVKNKELSRIVVRMFDLNQCCIMF